MTDQSDFMTQRDLEARWNLSGRTLERWRAERFGPPWYLIGGSVRYRFEDIEAFEARNRRGEQTLSRGDAQ